MPCIFSMCINSFKAEMGPSNIIGSSASRWLEERKREKERKENKERKRGKARTRVESSHHRKLSRPMRLCKCYATPIGQLVLYTSEAYALMQLCGGGGVRYLFPHCIVALHPSHQRLTACSSTHYSYVDRFLRWFLRLKGPVKAAKGLA